VAKALTGLRKYIARLKLDEFALRADALERLAG
jgi:hypothetical protein